MHIGTEAIIDFEKKENIGEPSWSDLSLISLTALLKSWNSLKTYAYVYSAYRDPIEKQTINMIGSCRELQWNMQSKSTTARRAADHYCATTRTNSLLPPPKIKSNRRFNALAQEVQTTFDMKHKKRLIHYKDTMRSQEAIRSNTEHICTTTFIR